MGIQVQTSTIAGSTGGVTNSSLTGVAGKNSSVEAQDSAHGDTVSLSGVSNLIALAKADSSPDRQAKIDSLSALVRSGQYQANANGTSRAMVQDLIAG
jgi:anti-sigma28 factor (negative regulator of flagellin synthesis)